MNQKLFGVDISGGWQDQAQAEAGRRVGGSQGQGSSEVLQGSLSLSQQEA